MIGPYSYADGKIRKQGFAKLKTLIDSLKDENTILIDNGDVIEGSPFTLYHYSHKGNEVCPVSEAMKRIGFDYINLGNHDFNYGRDALFTHIKESGSLCLTYNVLYKGEHLGPEYVIRNLCGRKLALFALTTHFVPNWEKPENIIDFTFLDAYECAVDLVKRIKEKSIAQSGAKFTWGAASGKEIASLCPVFECREDHSLVEGMEVMYPIYKVIGKIPAVRNISNKIVVLKKQRI